MTGDMRCQSHDNGATIKGILFLKKNSLIKMLKQQAENNVFISTELNIAF